MTRWYEVKCCACEGVAMFDPDDTETCNYCENYMCMDCCESVYKYEREKARAEAQHLEYDCNCSRCMAIPERNLR